MLYLILFKILGVHGHHENEDHDHDHDHLRHKFFKSNNHEREEESKDPLWKLSITLIGK